MMADDGALLTAEKAPTFKHLLERFEEEWLPTRGYAERTSSWSGTERISAPA
jgi:hypothetical protein